MFWQLLSIFIDVVTPVFALVLIGYIAKPTLQLEARTMSRVAYFVFVPAFTFNVISTATFEFSVVITMVGYITVTHIACAVLGFTVAKLLRRSAEMVAAYVLIATFGNVGNFGLSIIEFGLGEAALVPATIYFLAIVVISFIICVGTASWARGSGYGAILSVFKTPALVALIPATFFYATSYEVPLFLERITNLLGGAMIPTMLVALGIQLAEVEQLKFSPDVVIASTVRLVGGPALAIFIATFWGITGLERSAGVLQASMPAAVLVSIIAIEYNLIPEFVTTSVMFSTIASLFTLTFLLSMGVF